MQSSIDIDWWLLALFSLTLIVPFSINRHFQLSLGKDIVLSVMRMTAQLILIGLYLEYLFDLNNLWVNVAWITIMIGVGASAIIGKAKLPKKSLLMPVSTGLLVGLAPVLFLLCWMVIQPEPFHSAQYVIPLAGMLLGNSLSANIVALQNLYTAFEERRHEYEAAIALAAPSMYATRPFVQAAMQKSFAPTLASMSTMGLVTLPGMMTGQILGGASPMVAIKYQLMIMIAIFVVMNISVTLSLQLSLRNTITKEGRVTVSFKK
ncbi:ybbM seven transmembrane helix protein [Vibrio ishigakensis]|uniref:YbbM seven transmembrane helix protein n=1 Tax=Vibrio ishigakensis TaxID=1481914 RepID=A0A0B8NSQ8_9VIBR|nr:ABC transporter permease [Vibrio ishigakensis]GAM57575.1 ybbM seven transmembrane helix protein [Vibrio ishigakensis]